MLLRKVRSRFSLLSCAQFILASLAFTSFCAFLPSRAAAQGLPGITFTPEGNYVEAELIIQFKAQATDAELLELSRRIGLRVADQILPAAKGKAGQTGLTHARINLRVAEALALLQNHPAIAFAEPNWVYSHHETSDDFYYTNGALWGMHGDAIPPYANSFGSQADEAWNAGFIGSRDIVIGVIDEGIQVNHPDLAENIWTNPGESGVVSVLLAPDGIDNDENGIVDDESTSENLATNGKDDDGNGYIDDVNGWDYVHNDNTVYDAGEDSHGTHVSGTIGGLGGNGSGVAGVNWKVSIISGKFLGPNGGTTVDAVKAIDYFTRLKTEADINLVALNNSWGGGGYSQALHDAIIRSAKAEILFMAASGNGNWLGMAINNDNSAGYPSCYNTTQGTSTETAASYDSVISVTAIDKNGAKASWANYGAKTVDLGAPGVDIWSTLPNNAFGSYSGTSMATPHVTGAAALYVSTHPAASALQIKNALLDSARATPTASMSGKTVTEGRLNLSQIIAPPPPAPSTAPLATAVAVSSSRVDLSWTYDAGDQTGFKVLRSSDDLNFTVIATVGSTTRSYSNTGLTATTTYYYRVIAFNEGGDSPTSEPSASATTLAPPPVPNAPSGLTASPGSKRITLTWLDNSDNETAHEVWRATSAGGTYNRIATLGANVTTYANTGLNRGTTYFFKVRATNSAGPSDYSAVVSARSN